VIEVFNFPQNSAEWIQCRLGVPTASRFKDVMAKGKGITRANYLYDLAGEIVTGAAATHYHDANMLRGELLQPEARDLYAVLTDFEPFQIGFIKNGRIGASPDYLVGVDGIVEIKTRLPRLQIELLVEDKVPNENWAQIQGQLLVSGRQWVDFLSYSPGLPPFLRRVYSDSDYQMDLTQELEEFVKDLDRVVERLRG
jgi:hypothetical protein